MNCIRIKFIRGEEVKYISHLDLMRTFERAIRRARIPITYSQGFNPHPQMVFGLPLSVGVTSESEYADFELETQIDTGEFIERLNRELPAGIRIIDAKHKYTKTNIMATITLAYYSIMVYTETEMERIKVEEIIAEFLNNSQIIVKKESKRGIKDVDIKPMIKKIEVINNQKSDGNNDRNEVLISTLLSAGSVSNLKPELLIQAINEKMGLQFNISKIHRIGLFVENDNKILEPLDNSALCEMRGGADGK